MQVQQQQVISFNAAIEIIKTEDKQEKQASKKALIEFCESTFDMFDLNDFEYYANVIGCEVENLLDLVTTLELQRAKQRQDLTSKAIECIKAYTIADNTYYVKFNPFKKVVKVYCIYLERWRDARTHELKQIIEGTYK